MYVYIYIKYIKIYLYI